MTDIYSTLNEISSLLAHFNTNFGAYIANLDTLYQYANNNISTIDMTPQPIETYTMSVVPLNPSDDPATMTSFYKTQFEKAFLLRESLNNDIDQVADRLDLINNNSHNYDQGVHNTVSGFKRMQYHNVARYNYSIHYHRVVIRNKFIR